MESARDRAAGDRKPLTLDERRRERRTSSDRRKSGPKVVDVESTREEGKAGRRRQSDSHRRTSRSSKAAALRRERGQLRPPLVGHSGIGRASLPARKLPPATTTASKEGCCVVSMEQDKEVVVEEEEHKGEENGDGSEANWTPDMVAEAAKAILGDDRQLQIRSLRWLRVVLSLSETPPAEEAVQAGLVPRLVGFLRQTDCAELRPEALCALTNIASTKCTKAVAMEPETLPTLISILACPDLYLREQSAWCLGNIAAGGVEMRDLVLGAGVLEPLMLGLSQSQQQQQQHGFLTSFIRTATWALNNLCRGSPPPPLSVAVPIISTLYPLIESANTADVETLVDAGWALYHITRAGGDRIDAVRSAGLLSMMPDMLLHDNPQVVRPVIRAMDNLACTSAAHRGVRADALRLLSCIAAGSPDQVAVVASTADVFRSVVTELEEGNALCRREAAWVFLNMCECGHEPQESIIPDIVRCGGISAVCQNLDRESDAESLLVMLSLLFTILDEGSNLSEYVTLVEEADGFAKAMGLANDHDDMEIYDKAMDIIRSFADRDEDEDDDDDSVELDCFSVADAAAGTTAGGDGDAGAGKSSSAAGAGVAGAGSWTAVAAPSDRTTAVAATTTQTPGSFGDGDDDDDDDDVDMSEDSFSDDSFHMELAGTPSGPITPPKKSLPGRQDGVVMQAGESEI